MEILEVLNIIVVGAIPVMLKLIYDINKLMVKLTENKVEIENIKDDIKNLRVCIDNIKRILMSK